MASAATLKAHDNETKSKVVVALDGLKTKASETKEKAKAKAVAVVRDLKTHTVETKDHTVTLLHDPRFQTCSIATAGGAIVLGAVGGAFGLATGVVVGSTVGVVPALFTFGLSIPAGGAIGGSIGLCTGTLVGGTSGGIGGFTTYKYRIQIKDGVITVKVKARDILNITKEKIVAVLHTAKSSIHVQVCKLQTSVCDVATKVKDTSIAAVGFSKAKSAEGLNFATTTKVGVTTSSAFAGAIVGGASTGACGTVVGAAVGIVPAIFTFGLSIPVGAMVGLCVGTAVGGTTGAVGGGVVGYGGFTHRKAISEGAQCSWDKVRTTAAHVKAKTISCAENAQESARSLVRSSTGGSDHDKCE